jgi:hypothetical protein
MTAAIGPIFDSGTKKSHAASCASSSVVAKPSSDVRTFNGHTNTVTDVVGRIGTPPSLVIVTEGNHLMALLGEEIVGAFPAWIKSQPATLVSNWRTSWS